MQSQITTRQRLHDEVGLVFPELPTHPPDGYDLATPALLQVLSVCPAAQVVAALPLPVLTTLLGASGAGRWPAA